MVNFQNERSVEYAQYVILMNKLIDEVKDIRNPEKPLFYEIFDVIIELIQIVAVYQQYSGKQKKDLVIRVIYETLKNESEELIKNFDSIILPMIDNAIDDFIKVHKHGLRMPRITSCGCVPYFTQKRLKK